MEKKGKTEKDNYDTWGKGRKNNWCATSDEESTDQSEREEGSSWQSDERICLTDQSETEEEEEEESQYSDMNPEWDKIKNAMNAAQEQLSKLNDKLDSKSMALKEHITVGTRKTKEEIEEVIRKGMEKIKVELKKDFSDMRKDLKREIREEIKKAMKEAATSQSEDEGASSTNNVEAAEVITTAPKPLTMIEWEREIEERRKRRANLRVYGLKNATQGEMVKEFEKIANQWWGRVPPYQCIEKRGKGEIVICLKNEAIRRECMKRKAQLMGSNIWIEEDSTDREEEVQRWLHKEAEKIKKRGGTVTIGYLKITHDGNVLVWDERDGKLEECIRSRVLRERQQSYNI